MSGIGRFLIGLLGIILLYLAFFITVDEYGAIQNRLEALWKRIRSIQSTVIGWQTAFLSEISKWFVDGINSLFGASVFSLQSIACSVVICAVPMVLGFVFLGSASLAIRVLFGVYFLYLAVQATFRESIESDPPITWVLCKIILLCASPDVYKWWAYYGTEAIRHNVVSCSKELLLGLLLPFFLIFAIGVFVVVLFIGMNRSIARRSSSTGNPFIFFSLLPANAAFAGVFLGPQLVVGRIYAEILTNPNLIATYDLSRLLSVLQGMTVFGALILLPALVATILVLLTVIPLAHRMIWPFVWRPIYAAHHHQLFKQHTLFFALGSSCLWVRSQNPRPVSAKNADTRTGHPRELK